MKKKDIALIVVIAIISGVVSLIISTKVFVTQASLQQKVEKVDAIVPDFTQPDAKYFNANSIDPAQTIQLGDGNNTNPFNGTSN